MIMLHSNIIYIYIFNTVKNKYMIKKLKIYLFIYLYKSFQIYTYILFLKMVDILLIIIKKTKGKMSIKYDN